MHMLVRFKTDDTINWKGFSAAFVLASPDAESVTPSHSIGTRRYDGAEYHSKRKNKKYGKHHDLDSIPIDEEMAG